MKAYTRLIAALSVIILTIGCHKEPTASQELEKAKADTEEAARHLKNYTYAQKDEFVQDMQSRLAALNQELDQLSAKINSASESVKAEAQPKLQALRDKADQLKQRVDEIKNSNQSTWDKVKSGADQAYDALTNGVHEAGQWLRSKLGH